MPETIGEFLKANKSVTVCSIKTTYGHIYADEELIEDLNPMLLLKSFKVCAVTDVHAEFIVN